MLSNLLRGHKGRERVDVWGVLENRIEEDGATNSKSIFVLCGTLADIFTAVWASTGLQSKPLFFGLVHQVMSRRHTAVGRLADFQGDPSRTGSHDEHI